MELHLALLEKLIQLPSSNTEEIRALLDDVGLEVKGVAGEGAKSIFTLETLANRGDHTHHLGVAREISARTLAAVKQPSISSQISERKASLPIRKASELCARYALMEVSFPREMKLRQDVAAIMGELAADRHPIVSLLNYLQLEIGQPMHAFDAAKLEGEVIIDETSKEESIEALDGKTYTVPVGALVIRDRKKIIAVAGIIGCANSMVSTATTKALIEAAAFDPVSVRKTRRAMGISTDASYLFERGCDSELVVTGLKRLSYLLDSTGGMVSGEGSAHVLGLTVVDGKPIEKRKVPLSLIRVRKEFGLPRLEEVEVTARLKNLGYQIEVVTAGKDFKITVPSWRLWDVHTEDDLIEDVVRSYGLNRIKLVLPALDYEIAEPHPFEKLLSLIEVPLIGHGFREVITRGFTSEAEVKLLGELAPKLPAAHLGLKNAVEQSYSHMKVTNLLHLARISGENHRHGVSSVKIYEMGRVFRAPEGTETPEAGADLKYDFERDVLTIAASGRWYTHEWRKIESREERLALFKGFIDSIFGALGVACAVSSSTHPLLHPGVQGVVKVGRVTCGHIGMLHPLLQQRLDLKHEVLIAELQASELLRSLKPIVAQTPSDYPVVRRDLTLKIPVREVAGRVVRWIHEVKANNLESVGVLDNFHRDGEDARRLTIRLTFQSAERTLSNEEVDQSAAQILEDLRVKHEIELAS